MHPEVDASARRQRLEQLAEQVGLRREALERFPHESRIGARLQQALVDRSIDVLLAAPNLREERIHRVARETGIEL